MHAERELYTANAANRSTTVKSKIEWSCIIFSSLIQISHNDELQLLTPTATPSSFLFCSLTLTLPLSLGIYLDSMFPSYPNWLSSIIKSLRSYSLFLSLSLSYLYLNREGKATPENPVKMVRSRYSALVYKVRTYVFIAYALYHIY